jgi:bisphosphoglycerate-independent phosphoglycerate mutase (AlkP superfamily)
MKRFDKQGTVKDGYLPIFANNMFTMVHKWKTVNSMKNLQGFCACNELPAGRIAKLQGGYYVLNDNNQWEFISRSLGTLTFEELYDKLFNLKHNYGTNV